jgi:hypothetical protein
VAPEDVGVLVERDERAPTGPPLMGHEHDRTVAVREFGDRLGVALKPAVVLYLPVLNRGVQVEADEDALSVRQVVERVERSHTRRVARRREKTA